MRDCPQVVEGEAKKLVGEWYRAQRAADSANMRKVRVQDPALDPATDAGTTTAEIDGVLVHDALLDTGADVSLVSIGVQGWWRCEHVDRRHTQ